MRRLFPSPAMAVALVALGIALGGSAVAGTGLITGAQIKDHSIGLNDLSLTAVARLHGQQGPQGLPGSVGPVGPARSCRPNRQHLRATDGRTERRQQDQGDLRNRSRRERSHAQLVLEHAVRLVQLLLNGWSQIGPNCPGGLAPRQLDRLLIVSQLRRNARPSVQGT